MVTLFYMVHASVNYTIIEMFVFRQIRSRVLRQCQVLIQSLVRLVKRGKQTWIINLRYFRKIQLWNVRFQLVFNIPVEMRGKREIYDLNNTLH